MKTNCGQKGQSCLFELTTSSNSASKGRLQVSDPTKPRHKPSAMELDPFLALEHLPVTPPQQPPTAAAVSFTSDGGDNNAPTGDGALPPPPSAMARDVDPMASLLGLPSGDDAASHAKENPAVGVKAAPQSASSAAVPSNISGSTSASDGEFGQCRILSLALVAAAFLICTSLGSPWLTPHRLIHFQHYSDLNEELAKLLITKQIPQSSISALQSLLRENATLKEKNNKLKSLLGRSAKAQRDAKNELEHMKRIYEECKADNVRLERRVEVLANRPTHMDLLADFETNFDRAMLSIGGGAKKSQQSGGEDAAESSGVGGDTMDGNAFYDDSLGRSSSSGYNQSSSRDSLLLTELNEAKSRIAQLESLQTTLQNRNTHLERAQQSLQHEQQFTKNTLANLQLELRMSKMETDHALRTLREKEAIVAEMQLEINLVTQSAVDANRRAAEGMEVAQMAKTDKEYVDGLEAKVVALQEWALASTESKRLTTERCRGLEDRVKELEEMVATLSSRLEGGSDDVGSGSTVEGVNKIVPSLKRASLATDPDIHERKLWTKSSSLVVGAGLIGHAFLELGDVHIEQYETVILRWKFDLTAGEDIYFSVLKGICGDKKSQRGADSSFRNRHVKGGGGGDVSGAFSIQNACTLLFSNEMSWVRPRTVKWCVDAIAVEWSD